MNVNSNCVSSLPFNTNGTRPRSRCLISLSTFLGLHLHYHNHSSLDSLLHHSFESHKILKKNTTLRSIYYHKRKYSTTNIIMAESILFNIATEVLKNLGSAALSEVASAWGFKSQLEKLKNTINTLKDVLLDAEERQAGSHAIRGWLERLTTVVYAADDLFDEFATVVARKQQSGGSKMSTKVSTFFSSSNQIALAFKFSLNIKNINQELDDIINDGNRFSFVIRPHSEGRVINIGTKRDETHSSVDTDGVIGRDGDKKAVLDLLLPSSTVDEHEDLPVISIVGMGGMGKTTLAQLVYNDPKVCDGFELKLWVCVSDVFDIKVIVEQLLNSATHKKSEELEMDPLQAMLQNEIRDKKYLLVLDDVWNEDRQKWLSLRDLLKNGRKGSKILVTTRSKGVAEIMGTSPPHELQGLSEDKSWDFFEKMAFKRGQAEKNPQLVKVGKEIVEKCRYVPLAIKTIGSLLYGKDEKKWLSVVKHTSLAKIPDDQNDIMKILKISYDHLWSPLKNCFTYCALFPKDHVFNKDELIELWMAEGFIVDNEGQIFEEVGEEYFLVLLHRGFFQDVKKNEWGDITECKMHDLMHNLAQDVAGLKCKAAKFRERNFDDKIVHLSFGNPLSSSEEIPINNILNLKLLRTFLLLGKYSPSILISQQILMRLSNLRVLDLKRLRLKSLSTSIGKLIHLRYLDISENDYIEKLPNSITNLWNLQTLILYDCSNLKTLPKNMRKLTNLRRLDVSGSNCLSHMSSGIEGLTLLCKLPAFIVGHRSSTSNVKGKPTSNAKLSDLKNLNNLRGVLNIKIYRRNEKYMLEAAKEADLSSKPRLTQLAIAFYKENGIDEDCEHDEAVLEGLNPHSNIRSLDIWNYRGQKLPSWARKDNLCITLPNLVHISLWGFKSCKELPTMSQLCNLKQLKISWMESVEYMEGNNSSSSLFFPSLQVLVLSWMRNLKGWWKEGEAIMESHNNNELQEDASYEIMGGQRQLMQFSKLSKMSIMGCPNLRKLPLCPNVEDLTLIDTNESSLSVLNMVTNTTMMMSNSSSSGCGLNLKRLVIDNAEHLMSLPIHSLQHLSYLEIWGDKKLESSERLGEVFATLSSSLKTLHFNDFLELRSISKGLEHLTALENLILSSCHELDIKGNEEEEDGGNGIGKGMPWIALNTSLRSLELSGLKKLVGLPSGLQHLSNLRSLKLEDNFELKEVPEWISCLTSLTYLELSACGKLKSLPEAIRNLTTLNQLRIICCEGLTERCQRPNGSDWPKIQHIPFVEIR